MGINTREEDCEDGLESKECVRINPKIKPKMGKIQLESLFCRNKELLKESINYEFALCLDIISPRGLSPSHKELIRAPSRTPYFPILENLLY